MRTCWACPLGVESMKKHPEQSFCRRQPAFTSAKHNDTRASQFCLPSAPCRQLQHLHSIVFLYTETQLAWYR